MKYVDHFGIVYKMTERKYQEFLASGAMSGFADPSNFGKPMIVIDLKTSDMGKEAFEMAIEYYKSKGLMKWHEKKI